MSTEHPTPPAKRETPITDELVFKWAGADPARARDAITEKHRDLETQLAEANSENQRLTNDMILHERMSIQFMDQRDTLAEALRDIRDESPAATVPQWILERIDTALATLDSADSRTFSSTPPKL